MNALPQTSPPKVLILITPHNPEGGVHTHLKSWLEHLPGGALRVTLILSPVPGVSAARMSDAYREDAVEDLIVVRLHPAGTLITNGIWSLIRSVSQLKPDILHTVSIHADIIGIILRFFVHVPVHVSSVEGRLIPASRGDLGAKILEIAYRLLRSRITKILAISETTASQLRRGYGVPAGQVRVLRGGVELDRYKLKTQQWPFRQTARYRIGWIGRLSYEKGVDLLLQAAAIVRRTHSGARFVIAGDGPRKEWMKLRIKELGLAESVEMVGWVQSSRFLRDCVDILTFTTPSPDIEGMPWAILEALASGTPVVATPAGGIPEVIEDGKTGILTTDFTAESIAGGITRYLCDVGLAQRVSAAGRELVERRFSAAQECNELLQEYRTLLKGRTDEHRS